MHAVFAKPGKADRTPHYNKKIKTMRTTTILCAALLATAALRATAQVAINAENFPDPAFRDYVKAAYDWHGPDNDHPEPDGVLQYDEIQNVTSLVVTDRGITTLKGIEHFTALTVLDCAVNRLTELDLTGNTALISLYCNENQLTALDLTHTPMLRGLTCCDNPLAALDVSANPELNVIDCHNTLITSLDASGHTMLSRLWCYSSLLRTLNAAGCTALEELYCDDTPDMDTLNVSGCTRLTAINHTGTQLKVLDASHCTSMTYLQCQDNQLVSLDASHCTSMTELFCHNNQLTTLNVAGCTALGLLHCQDNQLEALDVAGCPALYNIACFHNRIKRSAMASLVASLPENLTAALHELYVYDDTDSIESNVCTKAHVAAAKSKGWNVYYYHLIEGSTFWHEYEGCDDEDPASVLRPSTSAVAPAVHTLHGQRVTAPQKSGIYIVDGKKVIVK